MSELPTALSELAADIAQVPAQDRLEFLVELGQELPEPPERYAQNPEKYMEAVPECQSPIFLSTEVVDGAVHLYFYAPPETVTTRGLAGVLYEGLHGQSPQTVLSIPEDFMLQLSLNGLVSPLRLNGMSGMLARIQRQVREKTAL